MMVCILDGTGSMIDIRAELPIADIALSRDGRQCVRVYGFADVVPPLVELRLRWFGRLDTLRLTIEQAELIAAALIAAAKQARGL